MDNISPEFITERDNFKPPPKPAPIKLGEGMKKQLATMGWDSLIALRNKHTSKEDQNTIAPFEHRAYAREATIARPYAALVLPGMSVGYNLSKLVGYNQGRSDPSFEAIGQAMTGVREGLGTRLQEIIGIKQDNN